jgi:DNA-directed RNA polymerase specialized sigma24 family protein
MVQSSISGNQKHSHYSQYRDFSNQVLIESCLENDRNAWEEFFLRFIPVIKRGIQRKLIASGFVHLYHDPDVLAEIHEKITVKLYKNRILTQCKNINGIIPWLETIARNQTVDWIKKNSRYKRLPQQYAESHTFSISGPLNGISHLSVEDTIFDDESVDLTNIINDLQTALSRIKDIKNEQKYWIFRLSILASFPLSHDELSELSTFCDFPTDHLKTTIQKIEARLAKKEVKRLESMNQAVLYWYIIKRLKTRIDREKEKLGSVEKINSNDGCPSHGQEDIKHWKTRIKSDIEDLEKEITDKQQKRDSLLKIGRKLCRPANREIAQLLGIPLEKASQISNILIRIRKMITHNKDRFGNE